MTQYETDLSIAQRDSDRDMRNRMAGLRVLVADRDIRTAKLVKRLLFSFGIGQIEVSTTGEQVLKHLRSLPFDILFVEWDMGELDGITLVREIRAAREDKRIRRDIPIIMLTGHSKTTNIQIARDAGINEFITKPFNAKAISNRIIRIIDKPREFIESDGYTGPCRRRRGEPPPGIADRRTPRGVATDAKISPPDFSLLNKLGVSSASDLINDTIIEQAQADLMLAEDEFVAWARDEIKLLQHAFSTLSNSPNNVLAQRSLIDAAYAIRSQAGIFGYHVGTEVAGMLVTYAEQHMPPTPNHLLVIGKHIDTITVVFNLKVEQQGHTVARELIESLKQLVAKLA